MIFVYIWKKKKKINVDSVDPHPPEGTPVSSQRYIQDRYEYIFNNEDTGAPKCASTFSADTTPILGITTIPSWTYLPVPLSFSPENLQYISMHKIDQNIGESTSHTTKPPAYNSTTSACTHLVSNNKTQSLIAIMQIHQHESTTTFPHNSVHSTDLQSGVDILTARKTHMRRETMPALASHRSQEGIVHIQMTPTLHMALTQIIHHYTGSIAFAPTIHAMAKTRQQIKDTITGQYRSDEREGVEPISVDKFVCILFPFSLSPLSFFLLHSLGANRKTIKKNHPRHTQEQRTPHVTHLRTENIVLSLNIYVDNNSLPRLLTVMS